MKQMQFKVVQRPVVKMQKIYDDQDGFLQQGLTLTKGEM